MDKKYELTNETKTIISSGTQITLHRIKSLREFSIVKVGDLGGWVESEDNLSHEETCWVYDNAMVFEQARVVGDADIEDNAKVYGESIVGGQAYVCDSAEVYGEAQVAGNANVLDWAKLYGNAYIMGYTCLDHRADVHSDDHFLTIGPIGIKSSSNHGDYVTFYRNSISDMGDFEISLYSRFHCAFGDNIDDFEKYVKEHYGDSIEAKTYLMAIDIARVKVKDSPEIYGIEGFKIQPRPENIIEVDTDSDIAGIDMTVNNITGEDITGTDMVGTDIAGTSIGFEGLKFGSGENSGTYDADRYALERELKRQEMKKLKP